MLNTRPIYRIREIVGDMQDYYEEYVCARILLEIHSQYCNLNDLIDQQLDVLLEIGYYIVMNYDYATPTGVGCSMGDTLVELIEDKKLDLQVAFDYNQLKNTFRRGYELGEWR